jgi:hypothetical protein
VIDGELLDILRRMAESLEKLAEAFAPLELQPRERKPAILSTAKYTREEQKREELRQTFGGQKPEPPRGAA